MIDDSYFNVSKYYVFYKPINSDKPYANASIIPKGVYGIDNTDDLRKYLIKSFLESYNPQKDEIVVNQDVNNRYTTIGKLRCTKTGQFTWNGKLVNPVNGRIVRKTAKKTTSRRR